MARAAKHCPLRNCRRSVPEKAWCCLRCWAALPYCYRLALEEHWRLRIDPRPMTKGGTDPTWPEAIEWRPFLEYSHLTLLAYIDENIGAWRALRSIYATDPGAWENAR